jgi:hypothetical protein
VAQGNGEVHGHDGEDGEDEDPADDTRFYPSRDQEPGDEEAHEGTHEQLPRVTDEEVVQEPAE